MIVSDMLHLGMRNRYKWETLVFYLYILFSMEMDLSALIKSCRSARWLLLILEILLRILDNLQHGS